MKKYLATLALIPSLCIAGAWTSTENSCPNCLGVPQHQDFTKFSGHKFEIQNDTGSAQTYHICSDNTACYDHPEQTWNHRRIDRCEDVVVPARQHWSGSHVNKLTVNYPWQGYCKFIAHTSITGESSHSSAVDVLFRVIQILPPPHAV
jgi:hypothetical protein